MIKAKQAGMADFPMQQEQAAHGRLLAALKATQRDCPGMKYVAPPPHSGFPVELIKQLGEKKCKHRGHNAMQSDHGGEKRPGRLGIGGEKKQVGYTLLTCGPPLFPMYRYRHYNTFCNE